MLFSRFGVGGHLKRLRSLQGAAPNGKTLIQVHSSADGVAYVSEGADVTRSCSTLANAHGSSSGRCQEAFAHRPNQQYSGGDRTSNEAASQHAASELHERLAALWGMPSELLFERQQTVARMLDPADCGTPAQALWLLVRAPQLRHASEASLRTSLKQLHRLVSHTDIDRAAVLTAVYKYPWIVEGMPDKAPHTQPPAAAAPSHPQASSFSTAAAAAGQGTAAAPAASPATWTQELAAVVLELQQADHAEYVASGRTSSRGLRMSPGFAAAAVRTYLAVSEVAQRVSNTAGSIASRILFSLPGPNPPEVMQAAAAARGVAHRSSSSHGSSRSFGSFAPAAAADCSATPQHQQHPQHQQPPHPSPAAADQPEACSAVGEVLAQLQKQQQQHLLLQQLLASCPHLTVLPPELLLARYERLQSVVPLGVEASAQLVAANPFLMVTYNDDAAARADAQAVRMTYA